MNVMQLQRFAYISLGSRVRVIYAKQGQKELTTLKVQKF